jgi:hypothetical protein
MTTLMMRAARFSAFMGSDPSEEFGAEGEDGE